MRIEFNSFFEFIYLIIIILIIVSLNEIDKSKCECGKMNRRFIKEWFIFLLIFKIFFIFVFLMVIALSPFRIEALGGIMIFFFLIYLIIGFTTFVMEIRLLLYLNEMRKMCDCAFKTKEQILFWFYVIYFALIILYLVIFIPLFIIGYRLIN
jgi:hypothetical protein